LYRLLCQHRARRKKEVVDYELAVDIARLNRASRGELAYETSATEQLIASGQADAGDLRYRAELEKRAR
jgi:hypothetical protein